MNEQEAVEYIHSRRRFSHEPGLSCMRQLMERLGNPEKRLRYVHVAGTNGKGSVTAMIASVLTSAGYKTGLSISPYVTDFRERFQIDGRMIPPDTLAALTQRVREQTEQMETQGLEEVGEFEFITAVALLWFAEEKCDIVCLEVGLGGRCDATNVIPAPLVTCITKIALDHMAQLGHSVSAIAKEKCGIIKPGTTVISYPVQEKVAALMIADVCQKQGVKLVVPETQDISYKKCSLLENRLDYGGYEVEVYMKGFHQAFHVAMAVEAALELWRQGFAIDDDAILKGIEAVRLPARMEILSREPLIVLDGCHNPDGVAALAAMIEKSRLPRMNAVLCMMKDKAYGEMLRLLSPCFDTVYAVSVANPRSLTAAELAAAAKPFFTRVEAVDSLSRALAVARRQLAPGQGLCVCGSLYLAGEARKILLSDEKD